MANQSRARFLQTILDGASANGWGTEIPIAGYRHIMLVISTASSAAGTIKIGGSFLDKDDVDFTASAAVDNEWDFVYGYNYNSAAGVVGDTGFVYSGTDAVEQIIVNTDGLNTLNVNLSNYSAGNFTVKAFAVTNQ